MPRGQALLKFLMRDHKSTQYIKEIGSNFLVEAVIFSLFYDIKLKQPF